MRLTILVAGTAGLVAGPALACPEAAEVDALAESWLAREPAQAIMAGADTEAAMCAQEMLVARLSEELGPPVGYKAGLTSPATQERFGVSSPLHGVLLRDMLLEDGATVPAAFGARPIVEADLVVVVGDAAINDAQTPEEVLEHVSAVHPFIELADLVVAEGEPLDASVIAAIDVGARQGVLGEAIEPTADMAATLASMTVRLEGPDGGTLSEAPGAAILGHPLEAVTFLTGAGIALEPGDVISLGSFGPPQQPAPGTFTAVYDGLPGSPSVSVTFE